MANNNLFIRCTFCHPRKGLPVDWATEIGHLFYLASYSPLDWYTKRESGMAGQFNAWLQNHNHMMEGAEENHFEIVDESQSPPE